MSESGSVRVAGHTARTAQDSLLQVGGIHDAELVERVWEHDLPGRVAEFGTVPGRRLGVLVDHLVADRKGPHRRLHDKTVLATGQSYVDIWLAVRAASIRWHGGAVLAVRPDAGSAGCDCAAAAFEEDDIPPVAVVAADALAGDDGAEPGLLVQPQAGGVLGEYSGFE